MSESTSSDTARHWLWIVTLILAAALLIVVIVLLREWPSPPPPAALDRSDACSGAPWIGILKLPRLREPQREEGHEVLKCPEGWEWVFSSQINPEPPPGLQRFCRYVGEDDDPRPRHRRIVESQEVPQGQASERQEVEWPWIDYGEVDYGEFERIERDCRIVGPAAETIFPPRQVAEALKERFLQEARGAKPLDQPISKEVRLVIVDSVQDDKTPENNRCPRQSQEGGLECSPHGEVLVKLARDLLCDRAQIRTRRTLVWTHEIKSEGLPREVELELDESGAGSSGTRQDLATAIRREVEEWWEEGSRPRLVLNLSVGWEAMNAPDSPMVRAAIQDAVCRGALVIAAAGNRVAGPPHLERPLLPAAWEQEPAPTDCQDLLGFEPPDQSITTDYKPLLYAVGGVQHRSRRRNSQQNDDFVSLPLSNSRPNSTPRLVAFGDHAPVFYPSIPPNPPPGTPPDIPARVAILTGTSVSTLVVSAAAVERWRQNTDQPSFDVMQNLWIEHNGHEAEMRADFWLKGSPQPGKARRIYVHPPPDKPQPWPEGKPILDPSVMAELQIVSIDLAKQVDLPDCNPRALNLRPAESLFPGEGEERCPQRLYDLKVKPALGPQPGADHNPDCGYGEGSPGNLVLEFDPCYRVEGKPAWIDDFTLIVADQAYRLPIEGFLLGDPSLPCPLADDPRRKQVVLTDFFLDDPPHPMYLAVTVNRRYATLSPLLQVLRKDE